MKLFLIILVSFLSVSTAFASEKLKYSVVVREDIDGLIVENEAELISEATKTVKINNTFGQTTLELKVTLEQFGPVSVKARLLKLGKSHALLSVKKIKTQLGQLAELILHDKRGNEYRVELTLERI